MGRKKSSQRYESPWEHGEPEVQGASQESGERRSASPRDPGSYYRRRGSRRNWWGVPCQPAEKGFQKAGEPWPEPPWELCSHYWRHEFPRWQRIPRHKPGGLFIRFAAVFGFMSLLVVGGMAAVALLLARLTGGGGQAAALVWVGRCGLALALPLAAALVARRIFHDVAMPLADVMTAADAVAAGDLSARARVPRHGPDGFDRLARSFNHMVEELQRADQQRRNLTADVAHELRTPLHIIQGNLEGILDDVYQPTNDHIQVTLDETRALARLVEDLRTLSLAEAGQLPMAWETVDVAELLADVGTSFSGQTEAAGIDLRIETDGDPARLAVTGDVGRLDQVLSNLVANAVRHTPTGETITLRAEPMEGGVRIVVSDTGEGIPAQDLPYIFDRFWRGDRSRTHTGGAGSGLGLAIARQLVQAHWGIIQVDSQVGRGTTFTIELPQEQSRPSPMRPSPSAQNPPH